MAQRYYFSTQSTAWAFAQLVSEAHRFTITDYGMEFERPTDEGEAPEVDERLIDDDSTSPEGGEAAGEAT